MVRKNEPDPNPLDVHLGELQAMLDSTLIKASLEDNALVARHEVSTVRVESSYCSNRSMN